jgi:hypothetical protein
VDSVALKSPAAVAGRETDLTAEIRNASDAAVGDLRVTWSIDENPVQVQRVSIDPRSSMLTRRRIKIDQPGSVDVSVFVERDDALVADNERSLAIEVLDEVSVLLVDGDPSTEPLKGETDFLSIALRPFSFRSGPTDDPIRCDVVPAPQWDGGHWKSPPRLGDYDVVVLANVRGIDAATRHALAEFVFGGGDLIVFDGDRVEADRWNGLWGEPGREIQLPAKLGTVVKASAGRDAGSFRIAEANRQFPLWQSLDRQLERSVSDVDVTAYRKLQMVGQAGASEEIPEESPGSDRQPGPPPALALLRLENGDPLAVSAERGKGSIVQFATTCDSRWTTLPMRPVFVPMMQQLVLGLAGSKGDRQRAAGQIPATESVLRDANGERLESIAASLGGNLYGDVQALKAAEETRRYGREIWRWLLMILLAAMISEVLIQRSRGAAKRSAAGARVGSRPGSASR